MVVTDEVVGASGVVMVVDGSPLVVDEICWTVVVVGTVEVVTDGMVVVVVGAEIVVVDEEVETGTVVEVMVVDGGVSVVEDVRVVVVLVGQC